MRQGKKMTIMTYEWIKVKRSRFTYFIFLDKLGQKRSGFHHLIPRASQRKVGFWKRTNHWFETPAQYFTSFILQGLADKLVLTYPRIEVTQLDVRVCVWLSLLRIWLSSSTRWSEITRLWGRSTSTRDLLKTWWVPSDDQQPPLLWESERYRGATFSFGSPFTQFSPWIFR